MVRKYNRVANIDEQIKKVSLPFFHWKVLFLVLEETGAQELVEVLNSNEDDISQTLDILENSKLIESVQEKSDEALEESNLEIETVEDGAEIEIVEDGVEIETVEDEVEIEIVEDGAEIETVEDEAEIITDGRDEPEFVEDVEDEIVVEPEIAETSEKPEQDVEQILEAIQESEEPEQEPEPEPEPEQEEIAVDSFMTEIEKDLSLVDVDEKKEISEESTETTEVVETEPEKVEEDDETSDITSFIEELGETESEVGIEEPKEIEMASETVNVPEKDKEESDSAKDSKTVMVIDDSIVIRKMVEIALEDDDYNIISSNSGKEGLKLLDDENPRLVILDMTLPDMNGIDLLKTIKASKGIPVIMLSGKDAPQLVENAKNAGADDFLPKPFRDEDLVEKVKNLIK